MNKIIAEFNSHLTNNNLRCIRCQGVCLERLSIYENTLYDQLIRKVFNFNRNSLLRRVFKPLFPMPNWASNVKELVKGAFTNGTLFLCWNESLTWACVSLGFTAFNLCLLLKLKNQWKADWITVSFENICFFLF